MDTTAIKRLLDDWETLEDELVTVDIAGSGSIYVEVGNVTVRIADHPRNGRYGIEPDFELISKNPLRRDVLKVLDAAAEAAGFETRPPRRAKKHSWEIYKGEDGISRLRYV